MGRAVSRITLALMLVLVRMLVPPTAAAQVPGAPSRPQPQPGREAQLSFKAGPFRIAPYISIGQVALDTNVFYTQEDRRTDVFTSGGPGLRIVLPVRRLSLFVDGNVNYYWFARTVEERRLGGGGGGGADWSKGGFRAGFSRAYQRTFDRPSVEVDRRVLQDGWRNRAYLTFGEQAGARLSLRPHFETERMEVVPGSQFLGTDVSRALTEDRISAGLDVGYRLTPKTSVVVSGGQAWSRFPRDKARNADSNSVGGGFQLSSETRLSGHVIAGLQFTRPKQAGAANFSSPYGDAAFEWRLGSKTLLAGEYRLDTRYSVFSSASGELPIVTNQQARLRLNRRIGRRMDFDLTGGMVRFQNDRPVVVQTREGSQAIARNDTYYYSSLDLGWNILRRLRTGVMAIYSKRQSNFADFGVDGLLTGLSIRFNP